jgi:hypothetical protein
VAAFEDEWRLMQQGYTSPESGRVRRLTGRVLAKVGLGRKPSTPLQIGPELR